MIAMLLLAQAQPAPAAPGAWTYVERTGENGARAAVASTHDEDGQLLVIKCDVAQKAIISVQFLPQPRIAAGEPRSVQLSLDRSKAEFDEWNFPGSGAYVDDPVNVYIYASEIAAAKKVTVAFDDGGKAVGGRFEGPGDDSMFRKVFAACQRPYAMPDPKANVHK